MALTLTVTGNNTYTGPTFVGRSAVLSVAAIPDGVRFASSLPALVAGGSIDTSVDPVALHHYLTFHSVVPAPRTILAGVRRVEPGTLVRICPSGDELRCRGT